MRPHALGRLGEEWACGEIERLGLRILERNARFGGVEVDILAEGQDGLHLIEVKTRTDDDRGHPAEAVTASRRARLSRAAHAILADRRPGPVQIHFDVIAIQWSAEDHSTPPRIEVLRDAFEATPW